MPTPLTSKQQLGLESVRLEREYQVEPQYKDRVLAEVRAYFERTFHNARADGEIITFQYHSREYQVRLSTEKETTRTTAGFPGEVVTGHLRLDLRFPNWNGSNQRLINRLTREIQAPWIRIDTSEL